MLIGFTVRNFRSFGDEQRFTFATSSDREHAATHCVKTGMKAIPRLSKSAIVFGPNGSGKTNLIGALAAMRDMVLHSTTFSAGEFAERYTPFRLRRPSPAGTRFEVDVLLSPLRYRYAFAYDAERILSERLLVYSTGKSQRWFERTWDPDEGRDAWLPFSQSFGGPRATWRDATRGGSLFLSTAAQLNAKQLAELFDWFDSGLEIVYPSEPANLSRVATSLRDATFRSQMLGFLHAADARVTGVRVPDQEPAAESTHAWFVASKPLRASSDKSRLQFSHSAHGASIWLDAADESSGIKRLACLFGPLRAAMENGKLLLIDEFDLSLHPLVARYVLQLINDPDVSSRGAQLLFTTHNTTLMDVSVLRRDEIWLMALDDDGASVLKPLWRHPVPPRKHELIGKGYLRGRYGAVPAIRSEHRAARADPAGAQPKTAKPRKTRSMA